MRRHTAPPSNSSEIHEEPHVGGSRVTVRQLRNAVEERDTSPEKVADHGLDVASVYEALAYYHRNPEEMAAAERRAERAGRIAAERSECDGGIATN